MKHPGDLQEFARDIEKVFAKWFEDCTDSDRPAIVMAFSLPRDYYVCHWVTNVSRFDGIRILEDTIKKMVEEIDGLQKDKLN